VTTAAKRRFLLLAFLIWICYTVAFSVLKVPEKEQISRWHLDLVFHFTAYLVMVVLGGSLISWYALIPTLAIAAGTEFAQRFLPYRTSSWSDFGVNLLGIALGALIYGIARRRELNRQDAKAAKAGEEERRD
jgi:VanZ family protein